MAPFTVCRPASLDEAIAFLKANPDAKLLAGGHSLVPVMKQGLAAPSALVDLNALPQLAGIGETADSLRLGALTRHEDVQQSAVIARAIPALCALAGTIGDPHVRHRGTIGGSLATNDPGADYPAAALALDTVMTTTRRRIVAAEFFQGLYSTVLEPDEILLSVEFRKPRWAAYESVRQQASGLCLAGVFIARHSDGLRIAVTGAGASGVFRARTFEEALNASFSLASIEHVELDPAELASDLHADSDYRAALVKTLLRRAVAAHAENT